jgi:hypothetical protein
VNVQVSSEGHTLYSRVEEPGALSSIVDCVAGAFLRPYVNGAVGGCATIRVPISYLRKKQSIMSRSTAPRHRLAQAPL